jgi:radical SAM superfamily enzyme YgiQ (UPF0313 family)
VEEGFDVSIHSGGPLPDCDVLGISATTPQYASAIQLARSSSSHTTVIGGAHATTSVAEAMGSPLFDLAVIGDGEDAFFDICRGVPPKKIPGVAYRSRGAVIVNRNEIIRYSQRGRQAPFLPYQLLEGRMGTHVNICRNLELVWDGEWRKKNRAKWWKAFATEVSLLIDLGVREVTVTDENFGCWSGRINTTVEALDRFNAWRCRSSVRNILDRKLHEKLAGSRCCEIEIDALSGSPRLLAEFGKHSLAEAGQAIEMIEDVGIGVKLRVLLGLPGETNDSMLESLNWLAGKSVRLETLSPYPGTEFYEYPDRYRQFGFEVVAIEPLSFDANNGFIPWRMNTISGSLFSRLRERMQEELR